MDIKQKREEVFIELVNKQLEPFNVTYDDVKSDVNWYMKYQVTKEEEDEFINYGVNLIREKFKTSKKAAEKDMSWFILQWGLTTKDTVQV